jgi:hypothetical protein
MSEIYLAVKLYFGFVPLLKIASKTFAMKRIL